MNLDHYHDQQWEVKNWLAIAANELQDAGVSLALMFSVRTSSDGQYVFYHEDVPATPEGDKLRNEWLELSDGQRNYLNLLCVANDYLNAMGTDCETAYRKEFELRAAQADREQYAESAKSRTARDNASGPRPNTLHERYKTAYRQLVKQGDAPRNSDLIYHLSLQPDIDATEETISLGDQVVKITTCQNWLTKLRKQTFIHDSPLS